MSLVQDEDEQRSETAAAVAPGTVLAWGANDTGQLGDGTTNTSRTPVQVPRLTGVTAAVAGAAGWSMALLSNGTVRAWGRNESGQLGDGTTIDRLLPVPVRSLSRVTALAAGGAQSLALLADGTVMSWGDNTFGELGDGTDANSRSIPGPVQELSPIHATAVAGGGDHSLALLADGTVRAWGRNESGQLGDGTFTNSTLPVRVHSLRQVKTIASGFDHNLALLADGTVRAWGFNTDGQLGDGTTGDPPLSPIEVQGLTEVTAVAAGQAFSLALLADGTVRAWGAGPLGDGTTNGSSLPVRVPGLTGVTALAAGRFYGLALLSDGTVRAWGENFSGNLGDGTTVNRPSPVRVRNLTGAIGVSGGAQHSLAVQ